MQGINKEFQKHYWSNFPQIGTAIVLPRIVIGSAHFAALLEAKVELSKDMGMVLLLVNPSFKIPVFPFTVKIPIEALKQGEYKNPDDTFNVEKLKEDVLAGIQNMKESIQAEPLTGLWNEETNRWVTAVYREKTNQRRGTMIIDAAIEYIAQERAKAGIKPSRAPETIIKTLKEVN